MHQFTVRTRIPAEYTGEENRAYALQAAAGFADVDAAGAVASGFSVGVEDPAFRCLQYIIAGEKDCGPRTKNPAAGLAIAASRAARALEGAPQERIICLQLQSPRSAALFASMPPETERPSKLLKSFACSLVAFLCSRFAVHRCITEKQREVRLGAQHDGFYLRAT